jgi:hypothetical protein
MLPQFLATARIHLRPDSSRHILGFLAYATKAEWARCLPVTLRAAARAAFDTYATLHHDERVDDAWCGVLRPEWGVSRNAHGPTARCTSEAHA